MIWATSRAGTSRSNIVSPREFQNGSQNSRPELVALNPDVIAVGSKSGIMGASKITQAVPLIMIGVTEDPVFLGLAKSFTRPGGNVTGFLLTTDQEILGKRLQLLRDAVPGISRIGFIGKS